MFLKILFCQIFLRVVCAEEKCRVHLLELWDDGQAQKKVRCDHDVDVYFDYLKISDDKPFRIHIYCENLDSSFYNLMPLLNVSDLESVEELSVLKCGLPELYSLLQIKLPRVFKLKLLDVRLTQKFFDKETKIEEIEVDYGGVIEIKYFSFIRMPKLRKLYVSSAATYRVNGKTIRMHGVVLKEDELADNPRLTHVIIPRSNIEHLPKTLFGSSTKVQEINFNHNKIKHVSKNLFKKLTKLRVINFRWNQISSIDL